jgi:hypothetical protein
MAPLQQLRAVAVQFARQLRGGHLLGEPAQDQDPFPGSALRRVEDRAREGIEDPTAVGTAIDDDWHAIMTMKLQVIIPVTAGTGQAVGVQPSDQEVVAGLFVHQVRQREVHDRLRVQTPGSVTP